MPCWRLASLQEKLAQKFEHGQAIVGERQSIGIVNVHERFVLYFGDLLPNQVTKSAEQEEGVRYHILQDE